MEILSMLISILKGQYDSFMGNKGMIFLKQQFFNGKWKDLLVFVERKWQNGLAICTPAMIVSSIGGGWFQLWHNGAYLTGH